VLATKVPTWDDPVVSQVDVVVEDVIDWFSANARDLPWRDTTPWGVLVSEFMLQQTQVARVMPVWRAWLERWPRPADLAAEPQSEAIIAWGRLGYPRRAARLHATAKELESRFSGQVPANYSDLRSLPGVGDYTAAAVLAFAFGERALVLDVNVRRVLSRAFLGQAHPGNGISRIERELAERLAPRDAAASAAWAAASMELGAVVCTAANPQCTSCPVQRACAWHREGRPQNADRPRGQATFAGSDRQVRGAIMATLRVATTSQSRVQLRPPEVDEEQADRALSSLLSDGLVEQLRSGRYRLAR
jgi:A/G-specific adenine glycosylase